MTLNEKILEFLRDAQYRIAQISVEMDDLEDSGSYDYRQLFNSRLELSIFMDILYEGKWLIDDDEFNHMQIGSEWTEQELLLEMERVRYRNKMNEMPFINFTAHYSSIEQFSETTNNGELPAGLQGQFLVYGMGGVPYADYLSSVQGHTTETIDEFFG